MFKGFFRFETEYPMGSGFTHFGPCHLTWLFVIAVFIWVSSKWYCKKDRDSQQRINRVTGVVLPLMEIYRDAVLVATGYWNVGFLPFHLCSMALLVAFLYAFTGWRFFGVVYVLLCMPGAAAALVFPNWTIYPFLSYMHIHAFLAHGLTIAFGVWLIASGQIVPLWKEYWMAVCFGGIGVLLLYPLNQWLDTNFWFLAIPSVGSPLELIWKRTGSVWYIAGYFVFCMIVTALWQLCIYFVKGRRK